MLERCQYEKDVHLRKVSLFERCSSEGVSTLEMFLLGESSVLVSVHLTDENVLEKSTYASYRSMSA